MTEEPLPKVGRLSEDHFVLPSGLVTTPEDWGLDRGFELEVTDSAFETELDRMASDLVLQQEPSNDKPILSHEEVKEALRQALAEQQASGDTTPLSVEMARLANRVKVESGSVWKEAERRHEAWSARLAPTLPTLNNDGSVAAPATLTKSVLLGLGVFFALLILTAPWNIALVLAVIAGFGYGGQPVWRPKVVTARAWVKKYVEPADKSPRE